MKTKSTILMCIAVALVSVRCLAEDGNAPAFRDLFNGKDLAGWVNVNTAEDTWNKYTIVCVDGITTPENTAPIIKNK